MAKFTVTPPADVPAEHSQKYCQNFDAITHGTGRLFLFACDQKIEHMSGDFIGQGIAPDSIDPEHFFQIAHQGRIGAMASHFGLIARWGKLYSDINYIVKLNGKTNFIPTKERDPLSQELWSVDDVVRLAHESKLKIRGVGYTIYIGSEFEQQMMAEAAQIVTQAHQHGLITILWIYPRGKNVDEKKENLAADAAGVAASLGSDFVKIKAPATIHELRLAVAAAGNTRVICSGGERENPTVFLETLYKQIHEANAHGCATGRNVFQKPLHEAVLFTNAISAIVFDDETAQEALLIK